jgi:hypothetical protein
MIGVERHGAADERLGGIGAILVAAEPVEKQQPVRMAGGKFQ